MTKYVILFWIWPLWMGNVHEIVIDHKYGKQINASDIAEGVELIKLDKYYISIGHLAISDKFYFVAPVDKRDVGFAESVYIFDKKGAFLGELYKGENIILALAYNRVKDQLYIAHGKRVVIYDVKQRKIIGQITPENGIVNITSFENEIFIGTTVYQADKKTYLIDSYSATDFKFNKTRKEISYDLSKASSPLAKSVARRNSFSSTEGSLFISLGEVNEIYSSQNNFEIPVIRFKNLNQKNDIGYDIIMSGNQGITGRFATTSFRNKGKMYLLFYDLKNRRQYLSEKNNTSGIYDDYNHSGNYMPRLMNLSTYMYSYKNQNEETTTIALFKIKS